jgi:glycosyltransferase involved in cell wall biosynthesis
VTTLTPDPTPDFAAAPPLGPLDPIRGSRVLMVAPQPFYQDRGTPIAVAQVLRALSELGYRVDVLTYPIGSSVDLPGVRIFRAPNPLGFDHVAIGLSARKLVLDAALVAALRRRLARERYACIHAVEEAAFPAVVFGPRRGVPVIYDMQSSLGQQLSKLPPFRNQIARSVFRQCERWLLSRASFTVSSSGLSRRVENLVPGARVAEWRYSSVQEPATPEEIAALRTELGIPPEARVVMYSGTFELYQGLPRLLSAARYVLQELPETVLVLVGADPRQVVALQHAATGILPRGAVRVVPRQPRERIGRFLAMGDVLVSPRLYGGNLPLKVFDYLAAGRPIVATDIPTHRTLLAQDRADLVGVDPAEIAAGIVRLLRDEERASRMAAAAADYARTHLGWMAFVQSVDDVYREVLTGATAGDRDDA